METFANPVGGGRKDPWKRIQRVISMYQDDDGWISRNKLQQNIGRAYGTAQVMVDTLNEHQDELERREVPSGTRMREEFRLREDRPSAIEQAANRLRAAQNIFDAEARNGN